MSYFDPRIYCKQNLKGEDLRRLELIEEVGVQALDRAYDVFEESCDEASGLLDDIKKEIVKSYKEFAREELGDILQDFVVGFIDGYEEDVEPVEEPETFFYAACDEETEDDLEFLD